MLLREVLLLTPKLMQFFTMTIALKLKGKNQGKYMRLLIKKSLRVAFKNLQNNEELDERFIKN